MNVLLLLLAVVVYYTPGTTRDQHNKVWKQEPECLPQTDYGSLSLLYLYTYCYLIYNLLLSFAGIFLSCQSHKHGIRDREVIGDRRLRFKCWLYHLMNDFGQFTTMLRSIFSIYEMEITSKGYNNDYMRCYIIKIPIIVQYLYKVGIQPKLNQNLIYLLSPLYNFSIPILFST